MISKNVSLHGIEDNLRVDGLLLVLFCQEALNLGLMDRGI